MSGGFYVIEADRWNSTKESRYSIKLVSILQWKKETNK